MLTFDTSKHEYRWNGNVVPSVTQILSPMMNFSMLNPEVLQRAQKLGTAVHRMTELYDKDDLDTDSLSDELKPYLTAWIRFKDDCGFEPATIESQLYHPIHGFSGTSDRTGPVRGRMAVLDIKKMATLGPVIGMQLSAYQALHSLHGPQILDRYALGLRPDGTYRMVPYKDPLDFPAFLSLLTLRNWRLKNGIA
ncbi:hypothetical protein BCF11_0480 [Collimonas sp. PA-H2]|uniref:hypothetical protein n=1 Tax=Collimonas sp. PA-H2 TaxID=1881062 RepID=UPI000BF83EBF|nr:hypothetical protein [Collimonas sp. PA-H2]PFH08128.1 hypothetical protein BCF11_0480 [Collimonas sp. PA-H2]